MRFIRGAVSMIGLLGVAACGPGEVQPSVDLSFLDDLELAVSAAEEAGPISPIEMGNPAKSLVEEPVATAPPPPAPAARATQSSAPAPRPAARPVSNTNSGTYSRPAPSPRARVETVKHTKRDAAIGAGAGAVLGAVVGGPRKRVEGAVVGAVVGGVIGGVIGNNVDKSTRVVYDY